ncbi:MAG: hypothetical protein K8S87_06730 [Planctomycetes bacterium]|nr:hypothetical protein [Planctomycetota bacterium]
MVKIKSAFFCELAIEAGFLTRELMIEALKFQIELAKKQQHTRIGTILVDKGFMSLENVLQVLENQQIFLYKCSACGKQYNIPFANQDFSYFCLRDDELLTKVHINDVRSVKIDGVIHYSMGFPGGFSPQDESSHRAVRNIDDKTKSSYQFSNTKFNYKQVQRDSERLKDLTSSQQEKSKQSVPSENDNIALRSDRIQLDPKILAAMNKGEKTASMRKEMMSKKLVQHEFEIKPDKIDPMQIKAFESMNFEFKTAEVDADSEFQQEDVIREDMPIPPVEDIEILAEKALNKIGKIALVSEIEDQEFQSDLLMVEEEKVLADEEIESDRMILSESVHSDMIIPTKSDEEVGETSESAEKVEVDAKVDEDVNVEESDEKEAETSDSYEENETKIDADDKIDAVEFDDEIIIEEQTVVVVDTTISPKYDDNDLDEIAKTDDLNLEVIDDAEIAAREQEKLRLSEVFRYGASEDTKEDAGEEEIEGIVDTEKFGEEEIIEDMDITEDLEKIYDDADITEDQAPDENNVVIEKEVVEEEISDEAEVAVDDAEDTVDEAEDTVDDAEDTVDEAEDTVDDAEDTVDEAEDTVDDAEDTVDDAEDTNDSEDIELKSLEDIDLSDLLKNDFTPPETEDTEFAIQSKIDDDLEFEEQSEHIPPKDSDTLLEIKLKADLLETEDAELESAEEIAVDDKVDENAEDAEPNEEIAVDDKVDENAEEAEPNEEIADNDSEQKNGVSDKFKDMSSDAPIITNSKKLSSISDVDETKKDWKGFLSEDIEKVSDKKASDVIDPETETMELYPDSKEDSSDSDSEMDITDITDENEDDSDSTDIREILKEGSTELYFREMNDYDDIEFDIDALDEMLSEDLVIDEYEAVRRDDESKSILTTTLLDDSELDESEEDNIPERFATNRIEKLGPPDEPYEEFESKVELPKTGFTRLIEKLKKDVTKIFKKPDSET